MRLGVRAHDFGRLPLPDLGARIAQAGFCCVQFAPTKSIVGFDHDAGRLSPGLANEARDALRRHGVQISVLGCYINLADPDADARRRHLERFKEYLRFARDFGCSLVGTETGSLNADFSFHPDNHGESAYQTVLAGVRELVREAERFGVMVAIEGVERYVVSSPQRLRRLLDEVGSNNLQIIFDPVNLLSPANHHDHVAIMEESFALFGERIVALHVKDYVLRDGAIASVPAGEGMLDHVRLLRLARAQKPWIVTLLEDTRPETVVDTVQFIRAAYAQA